MTPEKKSKELLKTFAETIPAITTYEDEQTILKQRDWTTAKQCAQIAVDEIIDVLNQYKGMHDQEFFDADTQHFKKIIEEINKL